MKNIHRSFLCLLLASISQEKAQNETKYLNERRRFKKEKEELAAEISTLKETESSLRYIQGAPKLLPHQFIGVTSADRAIIMGHPVIN